MNTKEKIQMTLFGLRISRDEKIKKIYKIKEIIQINLEIET